MKKKIIHVLCEGQTEQGFVEDVLKPYLLGLGVAAVKSVLITTNKKKNARGGMLSYKQAETDISVLMKSNRDGDYQRNIFTTMFDFYALPTDFPEYLKAQKFVDPYLKVSELEKAFASSINDCRFIPYIQLHEFEALLFCGIEYLQMLYPGTSKKCDKLNEDLQKIGNPELINNGPTTAPSKRIITAIEGNKNPSYSYNKPKTGRFVTKNIGIDKLRNECSHFNEWIERLLSC